MRHELCKLCRTAYSNLYVSVSGYVPINWKRTSSRPEIRKGGVVCVCVCVCDLHSALQKSCKVCFVQQVNIAYSTLFKEVSTVYYTAISTRGLRAIEKEVK